MNSSSDWRFDNLPEWDPWSSSVVVDQLCERTGTLEEVWRRFLVEKPWGSAEKVKLSNLSLHRHKVIDLIFNFQTVQQTHFHPEKLGYTHLCGFRLNANSWRLRETRLWVSCKLRNQKPSALG